MCTVYDDYMMYGSCDIRHGGQSSLSFWVIFCPLTLPTTLKIRILKKKKNEKKPRDIIILQMCTIHENHMMHGS